MKKHITIDNYQIWAITTEDEKILGWTVCDRNGERVTEKNFEFASDAIEWAHQNYKELLR